MQVNESDWRLVQELNIYLWTLKEPFLFEATLINFWGHYITPKHLFRCNNIKPSAHITTPHIILH